MAEPWIKMRTDLSTNPKVVAIAAILNVDEDLVVGKMHRLWSWADKHAKDGRALGNAAYIDRLVNCPGLAAALMREEIDWLDIQDGWVVFPRWDEHNSQSAKSRADAARRQRLSRDARDNPVTSVTEPSRQDCDKNVTRGDKRREEKTPPPQPTPAAQSQPQPDPDGGGGGHAPSPVLGEVAASAGEGSVTPGSAGSPPRSPEALALLDTLIGAGVWTSVASAAIDHAGVELVGACVGLWGKTKSPTPELLAARLRELIKPGSDIRRQCEQHLADLARKRAKAAERAAAAPPPRTPQPVAQQVQARRVGVVNRQPSCDDAVQPAHVPGITDHPAFAKLADAGGVNAGVHT